MNWSKAKTILIALLLAVDAFFLITYITRENELRKDEMAVRADVCRILAAQKITVAESAIPLDSVRISPAMLEINTDMGKAAARIFGEISESESADGVIYSGAGGSLMFSNNSFSLVYESGKSITDLEDAKNIISEISAKLGITTSPRYFECSRKEGSFSVTVPQMVSGVHVFDCYVDFRVSESGGIIASGKFIGKGKLKPMGGDVINTSALVLSFADAARDLQLIPLNITEISLGYISKRSAAGAITLAPTMCYKMDSGMIFIDMQTGKISGI